MKTFGAVGYMCSIVRVRVHVCYQFESHHFESIELVAFNSE